MLQPSDILGSGCHTSTVDIGKVDFGTARRFWKQVLHEGPLEHFHYSMLQENDRIFPGSLQTVDRPVPSAANITPEN
jgi:hypothetical protein